MACNMRCRHCGSSCATSLPDELTHREALDLCDQLAGMGTRLVTLSGGEPLLRADWYRLAGRLVDAGVTTNIISNGWLIDDQALNRAEEAGLDTIGVSLDGMETTHDLIRRPDSFRRVMASLERVRSRGISTAVVTTLMRSNLPELGQLKDLLVDLGVGKWQLQIGSPMGNLAEHMEEVIAPGMIPSILEFAGEAHAEGGIGVVLSDCLGYYTEISTFLRESQAGPGAVWSGCPAGRFGFGIRHDGDICGCASLRDACFIEGNVRETPLEELWSRSGAFEWNRTRTRDSLSGFCRSCQYGDLCLAGCSSVRHSMPGPDDEYSHCAHRTSMESLFPKVDAIRNPDTLRARAISAIELGLYEVADRCLRRALEMAPDDIGLMERAGYVAFRLGDWRRCRSLNEHVLAVDPDNGYALKGLGLALVGLGRIDDGIATLRGTLRFCGPGFMDPYHDLAVVYCDLGRFEEAVTVLEQGRVLSDAFRRDSQELYDAVCGLE